MAGILDPAQELFGIIPASHINIGNIAGTVILQVQIIEIIRFFIGIRLGLIFVQGIRQTRTAVGKDGSAVQVFHVVIHHFA